MEKQQFIHNAWSDLGIILLLSEYDLDGWINVNELEKHQITSELEFKEITIDIDSDGKRMLCRPKSLKGIENNNGWIKIETEDDLPKQNTDYFVFLKDNHFQNPNILIEIFDKEDIIIIDWWMNNVTHYQPIIKPEPPIY